jgi:hypothetical protein
LRAPVTDDLDLNGQCLALYALALAGKAEPAYHTQFYESRARLSSEERALLALAIATGENYGMPSAASTANFQPGASLPPLLASSFGQDHDRSTTRGRARPSRRADFNREKPATRAIFAASGAPGRTRPAWLPGDPGELRPLLAVANSPASQSDATSTRSMLKELLQPSTPAGRFPSDPFGCSAREQAIRLLALLACHAGERDTEAAFRVLLAEQKRGHWYTTQGNAWALLAMRDYLRQTEFGTSARGGTLAWGGQKKEFQLAAGCDVFSESYAFDASQADTPLLLASPSDKPLYAQVTVESRLPNASPLRQDHGFSLRREYERLNDDNEPEHFDRLRVGDRVLVTLRLAVPEPAQYVAVDDPLPGVLEALNAEFKTQQVSSKAHQAVRPTRAEGDYWWSDFQEIRADRVLFFANRVSAGNYVLRYVARARAAGAVTAPVAKVEEMYNPERFGLTEPLALTSEASE